MRAFYFKFLFLTSKWKNYEKEAQRKIAQIIQKFIKFCRLREYIC